MDVFCLVYSALVVGLSLLGAVSERNSLSLLLVFFLQSLAVVTVGFWQLFCLFAVFCLLCSIVVRSRVDSSLSPLLVAAICFVFSAFLAWAALLLNTSPLIVIAAVAKMDALLFVVVWRVSNRKKRLAAFCVVLAAFVALWALFPSLISPNSPQMRVQMWLAALAMTELFVLSLCRTIFGVSVISFNDEVRLSAADLLVALAYVYLCASRGILSMVEAQLNKSLPMLFQNFVRTFCATFLFVALWAGLLLFGKSSVEELRAAFTIGFAWRVCVFAFFQSQLPILMLGYASNAVPSNVVSCLIALTPLFAMIFKGAFTSRNIAIVSLGVVGAACITLASLKERIVELRIELLLSCGAAVVWAVAGVFSERQLKQYPVVAKNTFQSIFGAAVMLLLCLVSGEGLPFNLLWTLPVRSAALLVFLICAFSFVSLLATVFLLDKIGPVYATSVWFVVPAVSLLVELEVIHTHYAMIQVVIQLVGLACTFVALVVLVSGAVSK